MVMALCTSEVQVPQVLRWSCARQRHPWLLMGSCWAPAWVLNLRKQIRNCVWTWKSNLTETNVQLVHACRCKHR